mmetsp:Transcript_15245/g.30995  ORF Transcript_15245/g.30995 Transcript_15245/m.30995 type:complete len:212 (+) Transcript_15245:1717-2352(+)
MAFVSSLTGLVVGCQTVGSISTRCWVGVRTGLSTRSSTALSWRESSNRGVFGVRRSISMVAEGEKAPDFTLPDQNGSDVKLSSFLGKRAVVLFFYPKDNTPGCTKEACMFRDAAEDFSALNAEVIGVSADANHTAFIDKHKLNFTLLSDTKNEVRTLYGVPNALFVLPGRVTYVIDKEGTVVKVFNSMNDVSGHVDESIRALKILEASGKL